MSGGGTAFPNAGGASFPSKGSVVVWNNIKPSGDLDMSSLHGGCPVKYGIKWGKSYVKQMTLICVNGILF